ncbi:hypothetical protein AGMMS49579_03910 [Spirochaetia bacterium]|nr:hypothetical protein AGMMS49579_03910 [Spirochaetia bacterium]
MTLSLNIDSIKRNRSAWPNPFQFEILLNSTQKTNGLDSYDPITDQLPINIGVLNNNQLLLRWFGLDKQLNADIIYKGTNNVILQKLNTSINYPYNYFKGLNTVLGQIKQFIYLGNNKVQVEFYENCKSTNYTQLKIGFPLSTLLFVPGTIDGMYFNNYYIFNESLNEYKKILFHDSNNSTISFDISNNWTNNHIYSIRKNIPRVAKILYVIKNLGIILDIDLNLIKPGDFVRNQKSNKIGHIISTTAQNGKSSVTILSFTDTYWEIGDTVEILTFLKDNFNSLFLKNVIPFTQYHTSLVNLIIPNQLLKNGALITDYPYLYIKIRDFVTNNISNNSEQYTFKVTFKEFIGKYFIKFSGDNITSLIQFNAVNSLNISIHNPENEILELFIKDTSSPFPPNPLFQISLQIIMEIIL